MNALGRFLAVSFLGLSLSTAAGCVAGTGEEGYDEEAVGEAVQATGTPYTKTYYLYNPSGNSNKVTVTVYNNGTTENSLSVTSPSGATATLTGTYTDRKVYSVSLPSCSAWRNTTPVAVKVSYRAYSTTVSPLVYYNFNTC